MKQPRDDFVDLYERYAPKIVRYFRRRLPADRVDDAVADTFLVAWRKQESIPDGTSALPWLYAVAYKVAQHQWRSVARLRRLQQKVTSAGVNHVETPDDLVVQSEESRMILEASDSLKPLDLEVLRLTHWEDLSHQETAAALQISEEAVRQRKARALRNLAKEFDRLDRKYSSTPDLSQGGERDI